MTRPILACMSWRGGARFERCLASIEASHEYFSRIVLSITSSLDSPDMDAARRLQARLPAIEVLCTGRELPTMQHQAYWVSYLQSTGASPTNWVYWLAYDDEVRPRGISALTDDSGDWPLRPDTAYFGPWAMRHERAGALWAGDKDEPLESWTSFPAGGPTRLPVLDWIGEQLRQPTYMQMSGSVVPFANYLALRDRRPRKRGPMRIEMAVAASGATDFVEEFPEPVSVIYGRSDSDRASYGAAAYKEDAHLGAQLARRGLGHPAELVSLARVLGTPLRQRLDRTLRGRPLPEEEWRVRGLVSP